LSIELRIEKLSKRYPNGVQALQGVDLAIPAGMFGLLGPNGAGKSTLMRTLATLQEADSGTVTFDGIDVLRDKDAVRRVLGYLPQEFGVYPKVSAEDLLDHLAVLKGISDGKQRRQVVTRLLEKTNLASARSRKLGTYSGGMKQRFGIAQALLGDPKLLIVDEPTAGLDPEERLRFLNLLADIGENIVIILSTHIVSDIADLCRNVAIINEGRVLRSGDPLTLLRELEGQIWRRFVTPEELARYEGSHQIVSKRRAAGRLVVRVHEGASPGEGFEPATPDLEDVYFLAIRPSKRDGEGSARS